MKGWQSRKSDETAFINFLGSTLFLKKKPGFEADNKTIVSDAFVHHCKLICICCIKQHFRTFFFG